MRFSQRSSSFCTGQERVDLVNHAGKQTWAPTVKAGVICTLSVCKQANLIQTDTHLVDTAPHPLHDHTNTRTHGTEVASILQLHVFCLYPLSEKPVDRHNSRNAPHNITATHMWPCHAKGTTPYNVNACLQSLLQVDCQPHLASTPQTQHILSTHSPCLFNPEGQSNQPFAVCSRATHGSHRRLNGDMSDHQTLLSQQACGPTVQREFAAQNTSPTHEQSRQRVLGHRMLFHRVQVVACVEP